MAWVLNEELYGPGGGDYINDAGQPTPDPYGSLRPGAPPAPPAEGAGFQPVAPVDPSRQPGVVPAGPNVVRGDAYRPAGALPAPVAGGPPDPLAVRSASAFDSGFQPAPAGPTTVKTTDTTRGNETSSTGLSDADKAKAEGAIDATKTAREASGAASAQQLTDAAALDQTRGAERMSAAIAENQLVADRIAAQEKVLGEVDNKLKAGADWRPDRQALFKGSGGTMRGISAAVAAMAGGWLMGQGLTGGKNPYLDAIIDMINEDVNDQVRQNTNVMQQLKEHKGDAQAAIAALKQRQLAVATQYLEAQSLKDKGDLAQKGVAAAKAQFAAQDAQWEADQRKALMRSETKKLSSSTHTKTTTGTPQAQQAKKAGQAAAIRKMDRIISTIERGVQTGALNSVLGVQDKLGYLPGGNEFQEFFGGLPNDQKEQMQNLDELKVQNLLSTTREFNNIKAQDALMNLRVPKNDRDVPVSLKALKTARDEMLGEYQSAAPTAETPQPEQDEAF